MLWRDVGRAYPHLDPAPIGWTALIAGSVAMASVEAVKRLLPLRVGYNRWVLGGWHISVGSQRLDGRRLLGFNRGSSSIYALEPERLVAQLARQIELKADLGSEGRPVGSQDGGVRGEDRGVGSQGRVVCGEDRARLDAALDALTVSLQMGWKYVVTALAWAAAWVTAGVYNSTNLDGWANGLAGAAVGGVVAWFLRDLVSIVESHRP